MSMRTVLDFERVDLAADVRRDDAPRAPPLGQWGGRAEDVVRRLAHGRVADEHRVGHRAPQLERRRPAQRRGLARGVAPAGAGGQRERQRRTVGVAGDERARRRRALGPDDDAVVRAVDLRLQAAVDVHGAELGPGERHVGQRRAGVELPQPDAARLREGDHAVAVLRHRRSGQRPAAGADAERVAQEIVVQDAADAARAARRRQQALAAAADGHARVHGGVAAVGEDRVVERRPALAAGERARHAVDRLPERHPREARVVLGVDVRRVRRAAGGEREVLRRGRQAQPEDLAREDVRAAVDALLAPGDDPHAVRAHGDLRAQHARAGVRAGLDVGRDRDQRPRVRPPVQARDDDVARLRERRVRDVVDRHVGRRVGARAEQHRRAPGLVAGDLQARVDEPAAGEDDREPTVAPGRDRRAGPGATRAEALGRLELAADEARDEDALGADVGDAAGPVAREVQVGDPQPGRGAVDRVTRERAACADAGTARARRSTNRGRRRRMVSRGRGRQDAVRNPVPRAKLRKGTSCTRRPGREVPSACRCCS